MKICIIYSTRRGSTRKVVRIMAEAIRDSAEVRVSHVKENPEIKNCDLIIVGAPIYYESPLAEVREFITQHNGLEGKKVAVFILCIADRFGKFGKRYTERRYINTMCKLVKGEIIARKVFDGWILNENEKTLVEAGKWAKRVVEALKHGEVIQGIEHSGG